MGFGVERSFGAYLECAVLRRQVHEIAVKNLKKDLGARLSLKETHQHWHLEGREAEPIMRHGARWVFEDKASAFILESGIASQVKRSMLKGWAGFPGGRKGSWLTGMFLAGFLSTEWITSPTRIRPPDDLGAEECNARGF